MMPNGINFLSSWLCIGQSLARKPVNSGVLMSVVLIFFYLKFVIMAVLSDVLGLNLFDFKSYQATVTPFVLNVDHSKQFLVDK